MHHDIVQSFIFKVDLWQNQMKQGNPASCFNLNSVFNKGNLKSELKKQINTHLFDLRVLINQILFGH